MEALFESLEEFFSVFVRYGVLALELTGVIIILWTAVKSIISLIRHRGNVRLDLAKGIAFALEFKLGSEVLRTAIVRDVHELVITGAIIAMRAIMTFLIHWEIRIEESHMPKL